VCRAGEIFWHLAFHPFYFIFIFVSQSCKRDVTLWKVKWRDILASRISSRTLSFHFPFGRVV